MIVTKKAMKDDITFIVNALKHQDVAIPSFLSCATPGAVVMLAMIFMPLCNLFYGRSALAFDIMARLDQAISLIMFFGLGFFIFILVTSARGKYLSLPMDVRENSLIVQLLKRKAIFYYILWLGVNIPAVVVSVFFSTSDMISWGVHLVSMLIIWFIVIVDIGRYDLALLSSAIQKWREGGDLDAPCSPPKNQQQK